MTIRVKPNPDLYKYDPSAKQETLLALEELGKQTIKKFKDDIRKEGGRVRVEAIDMNTIEARTFDLSTELHYEIKRTLRKLEKMRAST